MSETTATKEVPLAIQKEFAETIAAICHRARLSHKGPFGLQVTVALLDAYLLGRRQFGADTLAMIAEFRTGTVQRSRNDRTEVETIHKTLNVIQSEVEDLILVIGDGFGVGGEVQEARCE